MKQLVSIEAARRGGCERARTCYQTPDQHCKDKITGVTLSNTSQLSHSMFQTGLGKLQVWNLWPGFKYRNQQHITVVLKYFKSGEYKLEISFTHRIVFTQTSLSQANSVVFSKYQKDKKFKWIFIAITYDLRY